MSAGREHPRTVLIAGAPWQKTAWPSPHGRSRGLGTGRAHVRSRRQHRPAGLGAGMCVLVRSGRRPAPRCPPIPRYNVTFSEECDASSRRSWKRRKSPRPPSNDASAWRSPERRAGPPHVFVPTRPSKRTPRRSRPAHESAPAPVHSNPRHAWSRLTARPVCSVANHWYDAANAPSSSCGNAVVAPGNSGGRSRNWLTVWRARSRSAVCVPTRHVDRPPSPLWSTRSRAYRRTRSWNR